MASVRLSLLSREQREQTLECIAVIWPAWVQKITRADIVCTRPRLIRDQQEQRPGHLARETCSAMGSTGCLNGLTLHIFWHPTGSIRRQSTKPGSYIWRETIRSYPQVPDRQDPCFCTRSPMHQGTVLRCQTTHTRYPPDTRNQQEAGRLCRHGESPCQARPTSCMIPAALSGTPVTLKMGSRCIQDGKCHRTKTTSMRPHQTACGNRQYGSLRPSLQQEPSCARPGPGEEKGPFIPVSR